MLPAAGKASALRFVSAASTNVDPVPPLKVWVPPIWVGPSRLTVPADVQGRIAHHRERLADRQRDVPCRRADSQITPHRRGPQRQRRPMVRLTEPSGPPGRGGEARITRHAQRPRLADQPASRHPRTSR